MDNEKFNLKYTAPTSEERAQIERIRRQYTTDNSNVNGIGELKRLHKKVNVTKNIPSIILGIIGLLTFGTGLALVLEFDLFIAGCVVSPIGVMLMFLAYPLHKFLEKKMKAKYGEQILKLTDELLKEND